MEVIYEKNGQRIHYPNLKPRIMHASISYINSCIGSNVKLTEQQIVDYLAKMCLPSKVIDGVSGTREVEVSIPVTRSDILHPCDIMEDVAVAYGINNIARSIPLTSTVGGPFPLNQLSDFVRRELALAGWSEVLPLTLVSHFISYFSSFNVCRFRVDEKIHHSFLSVHTTKISNS